MTFLNDCRAHEEFLMDVFSPTTRYVTPSRGSLPTYLTPIPEFTPPFAMGHCQKDLVHSLTYVFLNENPEVISTSLALQLYHLLLFCYLAPRELYLLFHTFGTDIQYMHHRFNSTKIYYIFCQHMRKNSIFRYKRPKRAVGALLVWPHVLNHIFLYKFMRTRVGSPFTDIENAP